VVFAGDPEISSKVLRRQMQRVNPGAWFASLRGKDSFTKDGFEEDRARLLAYYQNHGYPDARIGAAKTLEYQEGATPWFPWRHKVEKKKLAVTIPVEAGRFYRMGSADLSAALEQAIGIGGDAQRARLLSQTSRAYSAQGVENLRRALEMRVRAKAKQEGTEAIREVEAIRTTDAETRSVRIRFDLSSMPPYTVRRLEFRGMQRFPDRYFRRRIGVKEGAPLDERALEAGLARLARTGYFKPIKKEDIHIEPDDVARSVDITVRVEELGQQRVSMVGGRGQFGSTLGIAYSLFNLLDREELLTSTIEGGPESLELAMGLAKEGFLGSRGSVALSVFNTFVRPRLSGTVKGPFFRQRSEGVSADYSYALTAQDVLTASYGLSYSDTSYSTTAMAGLNGLIAGDVHAKSSSRSIGFGWTRNTGDEQIVLADSVSGGWLGGSENLVRSKAEYGRIFRDPVFKSQNAWAFRTTLSGVGSYSGDMPLSARWYSGDEFVRGLRDGELGPQALVSLASSTGTARYSTAPAGANLIGAENAEYRARLGGGAEVAGFFDLGSGLLQQNWLGKWRPAAIDSTSGIVHGSTGIELRWTLPGVGVPVRAYYAWNVLRLNHSVLLPDGSVLRLRNRLGAFGWGLGSLF
jgi:outer membrane protein assembly factor BamA